MENSEDERLLGEMLREAERVLDHQVRALEEQDDKTEQTITLALAVLGGGLVLGTFFAQQRFADTPFLIIFGIAVTSNLHSLRRFLEAYLGTSRHRFIHVGPRLLWLSAKAGERDWRWNDHLRSVLADLPNYYDNNALVMAERALARRRGLTALFACLVSYAIAAFYILAKVVLP